MQQVFKQRKTPWDELLNVGWTFDSVKRNES